MIGLEVRGLEHAWRNAERVVPESWSALERALGRVSILASRRLRQRMSASDGGAGFWGKGSPAGAFLGVRTGRTRARISPGGRVLRLGTTLVSSVGSPDAHVRLMEEGGEISGKPWLRIPTALAQKPSGEDVNAGRSVRGVPGYRLIRTSAGKLWIVRDRGGRHARVDFMYLLTRRVRVRGRHIFATTRRELEPAAARMAGAEVKVVTDRANT